MGTPAYGCVKFLRWKWVVAASSLEKTWSTFLNNIQSKDYILNVVPVHGTLMMEKLQPNEKVSPFFTICSSARWLSRQYCLVSGDCRDNTASSQVTVETLLPRLRWLSRHYCLSCDCRDTTNAGDTLCIPRLIAEWTTGVIQHLPSVAMEKLSVEQAKLETCREVCLPVMLQTTFQCLRVLWSAYQWFIYK